MSDMDEIDDDKDKDYEEWKGETTNKLHKYFLRSSARKAADEAGTAMVAHTVLLHLIKGHVDEHATVHAQQYMYHEGVQKLATVLKPRPSKNSLNFTTKIFFSLYTQVN